LPHSDACSNPDACSVAGSDSTSSSTASSVSSEASPSSAFLNGAKGSIPAHGPGSKNPVASRSLR
jgi:hypothetical protein